MRFKFWSLVCGRVTTGCHAALGVKEEQLWRVKLEADNGHRSANRPPNRVTLSSGEAEAEPKAVTRLVTLNPDQFTTTWAEPGAKTRHCSGSETETTEGSEETTLSPLEGTNLRELEPSL